MNQTQKGSGLFSPTTSAPCPVPAEAWITGCSNERCKHVTHHLPATLQWPV